MTIDVALEAKRLGMVVVALTALDHAAVSISRHDSGKRLHEVADVVLDQKAPAGDSAVWIEGLESPVAPVSSVTGCTIINLVKAEVARLLTEAGSPPKVLTAACHLGESGETGFRGDVRRLSPPSGCASIGSAGRVRDHVQPTFGMIRYALISRDARETDYGSYVDDSRRSRDSSSRG